jgi:acyl-CoA thioesterase-1
MKRSIAATAILITAACSDVAPPSAQPAQSDTARAVPTVTADTRKVVLFIGTSLTAGYGVGAPLAFPALIQAKVDSAGLPYRVVNAGISGETSAGGLSRIDWALQLPVDILVLELGANDALRGLDPAAMHRNLEQIIKRTRTRYPRSKIVIAGMLAPPNLGPSYTSRFRRVFRELADEHDAVLIPFILEGVGGKPELNQDDGIHPTGAGHRIMANTVWEYLEPLLR